MKLQIYSTQSTRMLPGQDPQLPVATPNQAEESGRTGKARIITGQML